MIARTSTSRRLAGAALVLAILFPLSRGRAPAPSGARGGQGVRPGPVPPALIAGGGIAEGNGVYKATDAGRTWQDLGLDATKQIPSMLVDPKNPDLVLLAAQGDVHKKSDTRGVYRSTNGGQTWTKTLYVDDSTGAQKIAWADDHPDVLLATTVRHWTSLPTGLPRFGTPGVGPGAGGGGGPSSQTHLFKSTDEGVTWKEITAGGLPRLAGRTAVATANNTNAQRMFLIQNSGLWRSD